MTNQTPERVIAEVIEYHADTIGSHYDGCYKHHAVCLAVKLRDMLREPGVPDAPRRAVRELIAEARGFWGSETREYAEGLVSRLADALEAAEVRVKELEAGEISALMEARAETWDEAISAVFAWWSAPPEQRSAGIVNPYGIGLPVESEGE